MEDATKVFTVGGKRRVIRSESQWRGLIADCEQSGLGAKPFCEQNGITLSTFKNWRRKLSSNGEAGATFVPVTQSAENADWDVELSLGDNVTLRLRQR